LQGCGAAVVADEVLADGGIAEREIETAALQNGRVVRHLIARHHRIACKQTQATPTKIGLILADDVVLHLQITTLQVEAATIIGPVLGDSAILHHAAAGLDKEAAT
jgi:hypothetical protein